MRSLIIVLLFPSIIYSMSIRRCEMGIENRVVYNCQRFLSRKN
ncbi:truncated intracellular viral protein [Vaccinia virus]|uniref:Truncated intracellular viral protein n=1 Tax=Vaccinia virus TaxID=10245 RepID=A0A0M4SAF9_VACCV|nr:truncated intracellular viral protein [Vaccinia virus]